MTINNLLSQYRSPESLNHKEYYANVRAFSERLINQTRDAIAEKRPLNGSNFAYATTGSDGRLEKSVMSKMELMLIHKDGFSADESTERIESILNGEFPGMVHDDKEAKNLDDPNQKVSGYRGSSSGVLYPTRVLDAIIVYGSPEVLAETKDRLSDEVKTPFGRKVLKYVKGKKRDSARATRTGVTIFKRQATRHFDLDAGVSFYDEENNGSQVTSFKQGPLRLVQYGLAEDFVKRARNQKERDIPVSEMPANVVERLFYLQSESFTGLSFSETETLADCYQYFLWQYHKSQENLRLNDQVETQFEKAEVKERLEELMSLVLGMA